MGSIPISSTDQALVIGSHPGPEPGTVEVRVLPLELMARRQMVRHHPLNVGIAGSSPAVSAPLCRKKEKGYDQTKTIAFYAARWAQKTARGRYTKLRCASCAPLRLLWHALQRVILLREMYGAVRAGGLWIGELKCHTTIVTFVTSGPSANASTVNCTFVQSTYRRRSMTAIQCAGVVLMMMMMMMMMMMIIKQSRASYLNGRGSSL